MEGAPRSRAHRTAAAAARKHHVFRAHAARRRAADRAGQGAGRGRGGARGRDREPRDFYWTLHAVFVNRRDQRELFDQAFHIFWRNPKLLERMLRHGAAGGIAAADPGAGRRDAPAPRRGAEAAGAGGARKPRGGPELELDAAHDLLRRAKCCSGWISRRCRGAEIERAPRRRSGGWRLPLGRCADAPLRARPARRPHRHARDAAGRSCARAASSRSSARAGAPRPPPLVVLCDISGSMSRYSRLFLHFMHAVTNDRDRVHTFLFGTRLTNVTRHLRHRDAEVALDKVAGIGRGLVRRHPHRRGAGRVQPLLVAPRAGPGRGRAADHRRARPRRRRSGSAREMDRLHRSCRRLIWLNPLLRYEGFEPKSLGMRAMLPHVDEFRPVHNLESLGQLVAALEPAGPAPAGRGGWRPEREDTE